MNAIEKLGSGLKACVVLIDAPELEPDTRRQDWSVHREKLDELVAVSNEQVLGWVDRAIAEVEPSEHGEVRSVVARSVGCAAGALAAAGRRSEATELLAKAAEVTAGMDVASELAAGRRAHHAPWRARPT